MHDTLLILGYTTRMEQPVFNARMDEAVKLYLEGKAAQMIVSGYCSMKLDRKPPITEATCMGDYAID